MKAWVAIAIPAFGSKTHVSIAREQGFVRRFCVASTAAHDGAQLANVLDGVSTASAIGADTAEHSKVSKVHLVRQSRRSRIHFRRPAGRDLSRRNARLTAPAPESALQSKPSSPSKSIASACSYAPVVWSAPGPRSASPTSSTASSASPGSKPEQRQPQIADKASPNPLLQDVQPYDNLLYFFPWVTRPSIPTQRVS